MTPLTHEDEVLADRVRAAVLDAALTAFEDAAIRGLCCDGAWEAAVSAMRQVDLRTVLAGESPDAAGPRD